MDLGSFGEIVWKQWKKGSLNVVKHGGSLADSDLQS